MGINVLQKTASLPNWGNLKRRSNYGEDPSENAMRSKPTKLYIIGCIVIFLVSFALVYFLFGDNLNSRWWYIDDHEIMLFLGEDMDLKLSEIPKTLIEKTEVGKFGSYERYRPSYYFLRLVETSLWGNNPSLWYLSRIFMLTTFLSILWYLVWQYTDFVKGFLFILLVLSATYWAELISRLGPSETYTVLGLGLYLLGFYLQSKSFLSPQKRKARNHYLSLFMMTIGAIIAIGSKENFIILLFPTILLVLYSILKKRTNIGLLISSALILLYSIFVTSSIVIALSKTGTDIYGSQLNAQSLLSITIQHIPYVLKLFNLKWIILFTTLSSLVIFKIKESSVLKSYLGKLAVFYFAILSLIVLYLSQYFFYKGAWPTGMRYDFPGMLYYPFYLLCLFLLIKCTLEILGVKEIFRERIYLLIIVLTFIFISPLQYKNYFQDYTQENVNRTQVYSETIDSIIEQVKQNPHQPIFFESYSVWDYELLVSVNRFLRARGVENEIYINVNGYSQDSFEDLFQKSLADEIVKVSSSGGSLAGELFVDRPTEISKEADCITLNFSGITEDVCDSYIIR